MKKFRWLFLVLVIVPCVFLLAGCNYKYVVGIERASQSTELVDVYTITYSDGSTSSFSVENGEDGTDLKIEDIYNVAKANGYTGTFLEFLDDYLDLEVKDDVSAVNKAMLSSVVISVEFPVESGNFLNTTKDIAIGSGAGVIYKLDKSAGDAYIITNYHVVYNTSSNTSDKIASNIVCHLYGADTSATYKTDEDGNKIYKDLNGNIVENASLGYPVVEYLGNAIECEYVGGSMQYDIAVLKVTNSSVLKNSDAKAVEVENSDFIDVGSKAVAIGNPKGEGFSTTEGVISVDSEYLTMTAADEVTQVTFRVLRIDTAVNNGNSGGGLYNSNGNLIGIVNAKIIDSSIENIGYAIPSNIATRVAESIIKNATETTKKAKKATIGITLSSKDSRSVYDSENDKISIVQDVYISEISENTLASTSALKAGDVIKSVSVKGVKYEITRMFQLIDLVWLFETGDVVSFEIEGKTDPVKIIITEQCFSEVI